MCCFRWKLFIGGHVLPLPFLLPQFQKENFAASLLIRLDFRLSIGSGFRTSFSRRCGLVFQRAPGNRGWNNRSTERKYGQSDGWTFQKKNITDFTVVGLDRRIIPWIIRGTSDPYFFRFLYELSFDWITILDPSSGLRHSGTKAGWAVIILKKVRGALLS